MPRSGGAFFSGPMTPCIHGRGLPEHNRRGPLGRINPQFSPLSPSFFSRATASPSQVSALSGASAVLREICLRTTAHGIRRRASCSRKSSSLGPRCVPSTSEAPVDGSANRGLRAPTAQGGAPNFAQGGAPNFGTHLTIRLREVSSSLWEGSDQCAICMNYRAQKSPTSPTAKFFLDAGATNLN